ncbi:hypothetical protein FPD46_08485 [Campylobacter peloridis]|uniref:Lipoprotein n=1 Tax=Campylobacter peloridis TaxID=488546 RepID=A0A5C7DXJ8_9BACT|nr:hypothetical protein [Campylobacter peloridis]TXE78362.1 hypothetical protein FPD46_08485 [Campylobacter peloridis]
MKKILLFFSVILFFSACTSNQKTYHISMPNFKSSIQTQNTTNENAPKVKISGIEIVKNTFYSSYFEESTLNQRINKSLELLKNQLLKDSKALLENKGYIVSDDNPDYTFHLTINANLYEDKVSRSSSFGGNSVESSFMMILESHSNLVNLHQNNTFNTSTSSTKLDEPIIINYPIKGDASLETFRQVYSTIPTQINESMAASALKIDKVFITFYKEITANLNTSLPQNENLDNRLEPKEEKIIQEQEKSKNETTPYQNNEVIIFE